MSTRRVAILLGVAVLLGLAASVMSWRYITRVRPLQAGVRGGALQVVGAAVDLPVGTLVEPKHLKLVSMNRKNLPVGYILRKNEVIGRGIVVPMLANEAVLESKLAPKGAGGGLPTVIPAGMRGVSVKVDEVIGVAGYVLPGTRVDVLATVDRVPVGGDGERPVSVTKLVLQNVEVLAAGPSIEKTAEGKPKEVTVITLLVTPDDAEKLTLAANQGRIQLALRNALDRDSVSTEGLDLRTLVTGEDRPTVSAEPRSQPAPARARSTGAPRQGVRVEMYRGVERDVTSF